MSTKAKTLKSFTLHDLPKSERPRERLKKLGPESLSAQELLALILGIEVIDHIIVTKERFFSFKDKGLIKES